MKRLLGSPMARLAAELVLILALLAVAFSGGIAVGAAPTQAATAPMALYWYQCNAVNHVAVFTERVHIFCQTTTPIAGAPALSAAITWFAIPTLPDSATASRFMSLLRRRSSRPGRSGSRSTPMTRPATPLAAARPTAGSSLV